MTLPWDAQQLEWLQAMGLEVLGRADVPAGVPALPVSGADIGTESADIPAGLRRAARGLDLGPLVATYGLPRDAASRRAFWRVLRPLRKAAGPR